MDADGVSIKKILLQKGDSIRSAVRIIDSNPETGMAIVVDEHERLFGILTSGDVYQAIFSGAGLDSSVEMYCNTTPITISSSDIQDREVIRAKISLLLERKGLCFPIMDEQNRPIELISYSELEQRLSGNLRAAATRQRVLVIGGAGYLGCTLTESLLRRGYQVRILDNFTHKNYAIYQLPGQDNLEIERGDIRDIRSVVSALRDVSAVVLLAAVVGDPAGRNSPRQTVEINYLAAKMTAEAAKYACVRKLIYASTCSVYGMGQEILDESAFLQPVSHYARTKIAAEQGISALHSDDFSPTVLRLSTLHGLSHRMRFDLVVNLFSMRAVKKGSIEIHGGEQWRPFLHTQDAADVFVRVIEAPSERVSGEIFNVGNADQNMQICTLGDIIRQVVPNVKVDIRKSAEDQRNYKVSFDKLKSVLDFEPRYDIRRSISEMVRFVQEKSDEDFESSKYSNQFLEY